LCRKTGYFQDSSLTTKKNKKQGFGSTKIGLFCGTEILKTQIVESVVRKWVGPGERTGRGGTPPVLAALCVSYLLATLCVSYPRGVSGVERVGLAGRKNWDAKRKGRVQKG